MYHHDSFKIRGEFVFHSPDRSQISEVRSLPRGDLSMQINILNERFLIQIQWINCKIKSIVYP